jgi:uncharacterized phage protein gp47/JayE
MAFERKSMEQVVQQMIDWTRGVSTKVTDFRVGSRVRTLYEAVGLVVEEQYDRMYRAVKTLIEENVYTVMGFPKRQAIYSTGTITFFRSSAADSNYLIPLGTVIKTKATATQAPVSFRTTADVLMSVGTMSIDAPVICQVPGTVGNVEAGTIIDFVTKPSGVETASNGLAISNGKEEETADEQKNRFKKFIASLSRGTLPAIEYGATTAILLTSEGLTQEYVADAKAFEDLVNKLGQVDCYVWNGTGVASAELLAEVQKVVYGYYDASGKPVYGYKPAGIIVNLYSAAAKSVTIRLAITPDNGVLLAELTPYVEREVADFFASLKLGQTLVQTALETRIKLIDGVYDVKVELSTDGGTTYGYDNLAAGSTEILVPDSPFIYV